MKKFFNLEEEKNQYGDLVSTKSINIETNGSHFKSVLTTMACRNGVLSETCRCNSHPRWTETSLSRKETREILNDNGIDIPEELEKILCDINPLDVFNQKPELNTFMESSYKVEFNPLPYIRSYLSKRGYNVPVIFRFDPRGFVTSGSVRIDYIEGEIIVFLAS